MYGVVTHLRPAYHGGSSAWKEQPDTVGRPLQTPAQPCHHGTISSRLYLQDQSGPDFPSGRNHHPRNRLFVQSRIPFRSPDRRLPRTSLPPAIDSRHRYLVQWLFLLGTLPHVRQPQEISQCTDCHEHMAKLYGQHGIRLSAGHRPARRETRHDTQCRILRQVSPRLMERTDGHLHFHRSGRGEPHPPANCQLRGNHSQPRLLHHAPCCEGGAG